MLPSGISDCEGVMYGKNFKGHSAVSRSYTNIFMCIPRKFKPKTNLINNINTKIKYENLLKNIKIIRIYDKLLKFIKNLTIHRTFLMFPNVQKRKGIQAIPWNVLKIIRGLKHFCFV